MFIRSRCWVVQLKVRDGNGRVINESERTEFRLRWRASTFARHLRSGVWYSTIDDMPELSRYQLVDIWQEVYR